MEHPLLVTNAIIFDDGKFLPIKRVRESFKDFWSFPVDAALSPGFLILLRQ
jgi:ADP-ribose pyrophosphatase YjhB (NUDIX family)